jgi:hypothetical protein
VTSSTVLLNKITLHTLKSLAPSLSRVRKVDNYRNDLYLVQAAQGRKTAKKKKTTLFFSMLILSRAWIVLGRRKRLM